MDSRRNYREVDGTSSSPLLRALDVIYKRSSGGYLSPGLAAIAASLFVSHVALWLAPNEYSFATVTNLAYLVAACDRQNALRGCDRIYSGVLDYGVLILALLAGSSGGFHAEHVVGSKAHALDILFGMLLVFHVAFVTFSVTVQKAMTLCKWRWLDWAKNFGLPLLFLGLAAAITASIDTIYQSQLAFYLTFGPLAALLGWVTVAFLADGSENTVFNYAPSVRRAPAQSH